MDLSALSNDCPEVPLNSLYSLQDVRSYYYLTKNNLVLNTLTDIYCSVNINTAGYPYVTVALGELGSDSWRKVPLHKIIALARIKNAPYDCVEHINDNPLDLRLNNLKFSTKKSNSKSAFINGHRSVVSDLFRVELFSGEVFEGNLRQIQEQTGISRITLYDRFYKGPREFARNSKQKVKSVIKIGREEEQEHISNRSIDYRKGIFQGKIVLDNLTIDYSTK